MLIKGSIMILIILIAAAFLGGCAVTAPGSAAIISAGEGSKEDTAAAQQAQLELAAGQTGPTAWYNFEEEFMASGQIKDKLKKGPDLNVAGTVDRTLGVAGKGALFKGQGYLLAATNPTADYTAMTVSLWFRTQDPSINYKPAAAAWWAGGLNASGWVMATHCPEAWADDQKQLFVDPRNTQRRFVFAPYEWTHMVITSDKKHFCEYINAEKTFDWVILNATKIGRGDPLTIGAWMGGFFFSGQIDEVMIYNRALSAAEIKTLYQVKK